MDILNIIMQFIYYGLLVIVGFVALVLFVFLISKAAASGFFAAKRYYNKLETKGE